MDVRLTDKAVKDRVLRIWLRRVPEAGGFLQAWHIDANENERQIGSATLYGRGVGSTAQERAMLLFRLPPDTDDLKLSVGDRVQVRIEEGSGFKELNLDVSEIE
ncbi:MAG: hypothetical protein AAFX90_08795 [Pseudomonadota bacterium]